MASTVPYEPQLIPPPGLAPPSVKHLPLAKRIEIWAQLVDECDALVLAGIRAKVGEDGSLKSAYRDWLRRNAAAHEQALHAMAANLSRREAAHGE